MFVNVAPGYVPMHGPGHFPPCCPPVPPVPPPEPPEPPCPCPPKIYRNPPDCIVSPGRHVTVDVDQSDTVVEYTVNAEAAPLSIDPESGDILYGDGTPDHPLGVDIFSGATADTDGLPGAVPAPSASDRGKFLSGNGGWTAIEIPEQVQSDWTEEDASSPAYVRNRPGVYAVGTDGFVPGPAAGQTGMFLRGDGNWADVENTRPCTAEEMASWLEEE